MALLFIDGFDAGDTTQKWTSTIGGSSSTDTRFSTGRSWLISTNLDLMNKTITPSSQVFIGFALKLTAHATGRFLDIKGDGGVTTHLSFAFPSSTTIEVYRGGSGGTALASATLAAPLTWSTYLEISATIADAGGAVEIKSNGISILTFSGDTKNAGTNTTIDNISFGKMTGFSPAIYVDDVYICDSTGSAPYNTFLGDVRVHTMTPSAAGTTTQFTPSSGANYTTVDELPYSATDYVSASSPSTKDTYQLSDLPAGTSTIYAVQTNLIAKKTDAGSVALRPVVRSGGTDYAGSSVVLPSSDATISNLRVQDPATSTAWTSGGVNGMEAGMEIA